MQPSKKCYDLIKHFEGFFLNAYLDPIGIPTIGYGTIRYEDGSKVKIGDTISPERAQELLEHEVNGFAKAIPPLLKKPVNQNQFDSLVSFAYNLGTGNLKKSTLLKKLNVNPNDPTILAEFLKWNKAGGQVLNGLTRRRKEEADLYFSPVVSENES